MMDSPRILPLRLQFRDRLLEKARCLKWRKWTVVLLAFLSEGSTPDVMAVLSFRNLPSSYTLELPRRGGALSQSHSTTTSHHLFRNRYQHDEKAGEHRRQQENSLELRPPPPPPPPKELPLRFLRAGKGDPEIGWRRYHETLQWRQSEGIDEILREPYPLFHFIKQHYPHYFHLRGKNGEPCYYEQPAKTNLKALREGGVGLELLLRHYTMITEFQWQFLERSDSSTSIFVIDLEGIKMSDFVGETVDFVKRASILSAQHYPERAGYVFIVNVPRWFKLIWRVIRPIVDRSTLEKIYILRGRDEILHNLLQRVPLENIPPEYGGTSMPLGQAPEERLLHSLMVHNNQLAEQRRVTCSNCVGEQYHHWQCEFCKWTLARSY